jgi:hypothetical protein
MHFRDRARSQMFCSNATEPPKHPLRSEANRTAATGVQDRPGETASTRQPQPTGRLRQSYLRGGVPSVVSVKGFGAANDKPVYTEVLMNRYLFTVKTKRLA